MQNFGGSFISDPIIHMVTELLFHHHDASRLPVTGVFQVDRTLLDDQSDEE
jgi:hypothetical protein